MKLTYVAIGAIIASGFAMSASAQSIACGERYIVAAGDTLQKITNRAYGAGKSFQIVFSANRETIGDNPSLIRVGQAFEIPCIDAQSASTAPTETIVRLETTAALPAPDLSMIRIVTATDWAPFIDEDQAQGGMLTEIINVALAKVRAPSGYKIDFINDWGAHLQPLISDHAYDMSSAWFRPNCDVVEKLGEGSQFRCNNLDWSDPIFEQVIGYYMTPATAAAVDTHADLQGKTICRPAGYSNYMLEEKDLVEPYITFATPSSPADCFKGLVSGAYDAVVLAAEVSNDAIAALGLEGQVVAKDELATIATLHLVTSKTNPGGKAKLEIFNKGLRQVRSNGEWFNIVSRHMAEHKAKSGG